MYNTPIELPYRFPCNNCISLPICINKKYNSSFCELPSINNLLYSLSVWSISYSFLLTELRKLNSKLIIDLRYYDRYKTNYFLFEFACILNDGRIFEYHEEYPFFIECIGDFENELQKKLFKRNINIFENLNEYKKKLGWLKEEDTFWELEVKF